VRSPGWRVGGERRRQGFRLWVRMLALLAVPLLTVTAGAAVIGLRKEQAAHRAAEVERTSKHLAGVVRLGYHLVDESSAASIPVAAAGFQLDVSVLERTLGFSVAARQRNARAAVDADLAAMHGDLWAAGVIRTLTPIRRTIDGGRSDIAQVGAYSTLLRIVQDRALDLTRDLDETADAGGTGVGADVERLRLAYQALSAATNEFPVYFLAFLPTGDTYRTREYLAGQHTVYLRNVDELSQSTATGLPEWSAFAGDKGTRAFSAGVEQALEAPPSTTGALPTTLLSMFYAGEKRSALLRALVARSLTTVDETSHAEAAAARRSFGLTIAGAALVALLSLLGGWQLGRTVGRPLHVLADRARQVSAGQLDPEPVKARGAREVVAVAEAVNDLVGNMRLLHRQAEALAGGDLADPSLDTAVPGALGASMQRSVERLSESLAARDELEQRLRHEATHDTLTGLLNRAAATVALDSAVGQARRSGQQLALLLLDVDEFKAVNSAHGHRVADELLREVGDRFAAIAADPVAVARLDSDEFVLVAEIEGVDDAVDLAERALAAVRAPVTVGEATVLATASIGLALTVGGEETTESMLRDAASAVRRAKAAGGNRVEVFDADLRRQLAEREIVERALRRALAEELLELHYQPVVNTASGVLVGFEALCRWNDPVLGQIAPVWFISVAEGSDLILDLDRWVLGEATRQLARWQREGHLPDVHVAVNISGRHLLRGDLLADVRHALAESGLAARYLVVEITETVLLAEPAAVARTLTAVRELGVQVAIDDFGTGYTSIGQLRQLPVDILKVDRSLVSEVEQDGTDLPLVNLLVQTAHTLGLGVVAEGAESPGQLAQLRDIGCDHVQGFLVSKPLPPHAVAEWLAAGAGRADASIAAAPAAASPAAG
jgi:diguanylate cyclase (GGDEF)-like protein